MSMINALAICLLLGNKLASVSCETLRGSSHSKDTHSFYVILAPRCQLSRTEANNAISTRIEGLQVNSSYRLVCNSHDHIGLHHLTEKVFGAGVPAENDTTSHVAFAVHRPARAYCAVHPEALRVR